MAFLLRFGLCDYGGQVECGAVGSKLSGRYVSEQYKNGDSQYGKIRLFFTGVNFWR